MMTASELATIATMKKLSLRNTEKDYLLELLLFTLSHDTTSLAFKGGTALYKFYNLNRFSEDLDFDITGKRFRTEILTKTILKNLEVSGMQRTLTEINTHANEITIRLSIRGPLYDGRKESMSRVSLNLSRRERPTHVQPQLLIPSYRELPSFELLVLGASEIGAEKIRCIITREKPRDIYDLWFLTKREITLDVSLVNKKLKLYNLTFNRATFFEKIQEQRHMWNRDLTGLVIGTLPGFETVAEDITKWCTTNLK